MDTRFGPMASSSSSSSSLVPHHQICHDVFVSFRGTDVRHGFLTHLIKAFGEKGIDAYVDDRLKKGDEISVALLKAIEKSQISLVIFSKNYASSKWCLEELAKIIECMEQNQQIVIPVFYQIEPTDVRRQTGDYGIPFAKHEERYHMTTVQNWKNASKRAANLSGLYLSKFRSEVEFIEEIVKCVLEKLDNNMYQREFQNLLGIHRQIANVESLLCNGSKDVCTVGIWGMGGIGKTTIANALFRNLYSKYRDCCFKANIREALEKHKITDIEIKLYSELLQEEEQHIVMSLEEPCFVTRRLQRKKALVLFDDVNDLEDVKFLIEGKDRFGPGSIIIVTSRDKQVLQNVAGDNIYEVEALNANEALQLFSLNAFKQEHPRKDWIELSTRMVQYAKGNPLALKVLGSLLFKLEPEEWESLLNRLEKMPCEGIQKVLRLSYDRLERDHQKIFLFLACFFKRGPKQSIRIILDACGFSTLFGFRNLQNKALIKISNNYVQMHDLIREMGQEIVREESFDEPGERSHLFDPVDIHQVLMNNTGTKAIQSIVLDLSKIKDLHLNPQVFRKMVNLKLLNFHGNSGQCTLHLPEEGLESFPKQLRLFQWIGYPSKSLPLAFCAENLVKLNMQYSKVEKLWDSVQDLANLKEIDLSKSEYLNRLPDFSKASNLEKVDLSLCDSLVDVHQSILSLHQLVQLKLSNCKKLESLKSDVHLKSLRSLYLGGCVNLKDFSVVSEEMETLDLNGTAIVELPSSIKFLKKLKELVLNGCGNLKYLPNELSELRSLRRLDLIDCVNLDPSNLCVLLNCSESLEYLLLNNCYNLCELPDNVPASFKHLSGLRLLALTNCWKLQCISDLPPSINSLYVSECGRLQSIQELPPSIEYLNVSNCGMLRPISLLSRSHDLSLSGSNVEIMSAGFKHLSRLRRLELRNCSWLQCISDFPPSIESLDVSNCGRLHSIIGLPPSIEGLYAMNCHSLETVTSFTSMLILQNGFNSSVPYTHFSFRNCMKLGEHALHNIMECVHSKIKQLPCGYLPGEFVFDKTVEFCLPGCKVPDWFRHQARGTSITVPVDLSPNSKFMGFICCIIASEFQSNERYQILKWECKCYTEASNGQRLLNYCNVIYINDACGDESNEDCNVDVSFRLNSDHMFLGYDIKSFSDVLNRRDNDQCMSNETRISLEFEVKTDKGTSDMVIKQCGMHPLYASEYFNSDEQLELEKYFNKEFQPESSKETVSEKELAMVSECSSTLAPIHKSLATRTGTWKNGTSGLKQVLEF